MKIINILLSNKKGGVEDAFVTHCQILKTLHKQETQVLAIIKNNAPYAKSLTNNKILIKEVKNNFGYYDIFTIQNIRKIITEFKADIVFAHVGKAISFAKKALICKNTPLIAVNHSNNVKRSIGADMILCVNDYIRNKTISLGQNPNNTITIPNVINFNIDELNNIKYKDFSSKNKTIRIGTLGRISKEKNLDSLLKTIQICKEKLINIEIELFIAGEGEEKDNLTNLAKNLNIHNHTHFIGWIQNKQEFFSNIDIFCLPSHEETFGIVILEAMKYKVPVIASDAMGPKSIITNNKNGILVKKDPINKMPVEIYNAINELIHNQKLCKTITDSAIQDLINNFSYQSLAKKFLTIKYINTK